MPLRECPVCVGSLGAGDGIHIDDEHSARQPTVFVFERALFQADNAVVAVEQVSPRPFDAALPQVNRQEPVWRRGTAQVAHIVYQVCLLFDDGKHYGIAAIYIIANA